jgi:hypothetical protein
VRINAAWHKRHPMPKNPTVEQRIAWHLEHQKQCACRPIPFKLLERVRARGTAPMSRRASRPVVDGRHQGSGRGSAR